MFCLSPCNLLITKYFFISFMARKWIVTHRADGKLTNMKKFAAIIILYFILLLSIGCQDSNKKAVYELQEHCGKTAEQWAKADKDFLDYRAHYNARLNKCFILETLSPIVSESFSTSYNVLYDVNENKKYGQHMVRFYRSGAPERNQSIIQDKGYEGEQAKEKWNAFVKEMMEE
jgi:hypothetical protein